MHLSDYDSFPASLPVVVEDEIFLYPFMISPIFLTSQKDIDAASFSMENNSLLFVVSSKSGKEGKREHDDLYKIGVIGSIMRKVQLPDGRVKILFQGLSKGEIVTFEDAEFNKALVSVIEPLPYNQLKIDALMDILRDGVKTLSSINTNFPIDLVRAIE
ncbi:MAG: LON peptidase substrate-binding domain-containing protein, partial [Sulfurovaceae bacterium]|nr:LON peptidase substrate-binding domain-containing protein [Sulfurovaceae bacterium]